MGNKNPGDRPQLGYACFSALALCAALLSVFIPLSRAYASYEKGVEARASGDYEEALTQWMATPGDPRCMTAIGSLYEYGEGLPKDDAKAAEWYAKAAEEGEYRAIAQLANFSLTGAGGVTQNPTEWRGKLEGIEGKDPYADYILASFYLGGYGGGKDIDRAYAILDELVNKKGYSQLANELKRAQDLLADKKAGVLEAEAMIDEMARDRSSFEENYKDRRVVVSGWLNSAERMNDYGWLARFGGAQHSSIQKDHVLAVFYEPSRTGALSSLKPGTFVKFSGVYVGDHPFQLGDCAFTMFGCSLGAVSEDQLP